MQRSNWRTIVSLLVVGAVIGTVGGVSAKRVATLLTGADVKNGSLTGDDIRDFSVNANKIDGRSHLQFKGTYATARSDSFAPMRLYSSDVCYNLAQPNCFSTLPRHIVAKTSINVPFTGHVFAEGAVQVKTTHEGVPGERLEGNCRVDIVRAGSPAPIGGYERGRGTSYDSYVIRFDAEDKLVDLDPREDIEVTRPGSHDVYLSCGTIGPIGYRGVTDQLQARGRLVVRSMAN